MENYSSISNRLLTYYLSNQTQKHSVLQIINPKKAPKCHQNIRVPPSIVQKEMEGETKKKTKRGVPQGTGLGPQSTKKHATTPDHAGKKCLSREKKSKHETHKTWRERVPLPHEKKLIHKTPNVWRGKSASAAREISATRDPTERCLAGEECRSRGGNLG